LQGLKQHGAVFAWGADGNGQLDVPLAAQSGVKAIAAGCESLHALALKTNGQVIAWGGSAFPYGQTNVPASAQSGVKAIATGFLHSVALKDDGSVLAWGDNSYGQTAVPEAAQSEVIAIAAGKNNTVALKRKGSVVVWGDSGAGQAIVPVSAQSGVTAIASGGLHTVALSGNVVALGTQFSGSNLILTWPIGSSGFSLQSTASLSPPIIWADLPDAPLTLGTKFVLTNPISADAQ
jgi:alpha-tubulin suppressor-like RCC1 family protein